MKILLLTQHYLPEKGAAQNRLSQLAQYLNQKHEVHVHTAMPHYPEMQVHASYQNNNWITENIGGVSVSRSYIYVSTKRTILARLCNYFSFVASSIYYSNRLPSAPYDYIILESPPLFLAITALYFKWKYNAKLITNISDLWPDSAEKMGVITNRMLLSVAKKLETRLYNKSILVMGQTQAICNAISAKTPSVKTLWMPNAADFEVINTTDINTRFRIENNINEDDFIVFYGGLFGLAYDFELLIEAAINLKNQQHIKFVLIGDGPAKSYLLQQKLTHQLDSLLILDMMQRDQLIGIVKAIDCSVIPLKNNPFFDGTIPTKIFDILACGKPIILGIKGESKQLFIDDAKAGIGVEPGNLPELVAAINELCDKSKLRYEMGNNGKKYVAKNFDRQIIMQKIEPFLQ
jgi:glycosyltransferase involved in cell wall biosynthesis